MDNNSPRNGETCSAENCSNFVKSIVEEYNEKQKKQNFVKNLVLFLPYIIGKIFLVCSWIATKKDLFLQH